MINFDNLTIFDIIILYIYKIFSILDKKSHYYYYLLDIGR